MFAFGTFALGDRSSVVKTEGTLVCVDDPESNPHTGKRRSLAKSFLTYIHEVCSAGDAELNLGSQFCRSVALEVGRMCMSMLVWCSFRPLSHVLPLADPRLLRFFSSSGCHAKKQDRGFLGHATNSGQRCIH